MKNFYAGAGLGLLFVCLLIGGIACSNYQVPGRGSDRISPNSCEGCHTDYDRLFEVHSPDTVLPEGGCGGTPPYYYPYERVYLGGAGYDAFKASPHDIGCTNCHGGIGDSGDKVEAHSGDWIASPSMFYEENCGQCHEEVTSDFVTSIHNGTGQKRKVAMRMGGMSSADFMNLSEEHKAGYEMKCAICHGTCGNCHVTRPQAGGGGLAKGHNFNGYESKNKNLDMLNICVACHTSRGGHAYLGQGEGTVPDVHQQGGYTCLDCHDGMELHGDGKPVEQRYAYSELPKCEDCHGDLSGSNEHHLTHYNDFSCYVCHSQDYNNCGSCHIGGEGARIPHYMDFKLAINPIKDIKGGFNSDVTLVRRTLAAPDNWKEYGVPEYETFNVHPTYNYTTPHNIQLRTTRTQTEEGINCASSSCHMKVTATDTINKEFYLFMKDLLDFEIEATGFMTMDDKIPAAWIQN